MKPHEETLHYTASATGRGGYVVHTTTGDDASVVKAGYEHMGSLWAAAPELARSLVACFEMRNDGTRHLRGICTASGMDTCDAEECLRARVALAKAGVS